LRKPLLAAVAARLELANAVHEGQGIEQRRRNGDGPKDSPPPFLERFEDEDAAEGAHVGLMRVRGCEKPPAFVGVTVLAFALLRSKSRQAFHFSHVKRGCGRPRRGVFSVIPGWRPGFSPRDVKHAAGSITVHSQGIVARWYELRVAGSLSNLTSYSVRLVARVSSFCKKI